MKHDNELTIADFLSFATIYNAIELNLNVICDGLDGDQADEIRQDLAEIYELVTSAVSRQDGTKPKDWYLPISECVVAMTYQTILEIAGKIYAFNEKAEEKYHLYNNSEKVIIQNMNEPQLDFAIEMLLNATVEV